jgi:uncharacterized protein YutE (UPF0331/DUF86 family)
MDWEEYREVSTCLERLGAVPLEPTERLARVAGQRSILVHTYVDIDAWLVYVTGLSLRQPPHSAALDTPR